MDELLVAYESNCVWHAARLKEGSGLKSGYMGSSYVTRAVFTMPFSYLLLVIAWFIRQYKARLNLLLNSLIL